jgi:hypothetical protein
VKRFLNIAKTEHLVLSQKFNSFSNEISLEVIVQREESDCFSAPGCQLTVIIEDGIARAGFHR